MIRVRRMPRRRTRTCFAATLPLVAIAALASFSAPVFAATTLTVDDSGGADYTTIQAAIDAALTGDTIQVAAGTYRENLVWEDKDLLIVGAGAKFCVVNGDTDSNGTGNGSCLRIARVNAPSSISGFRFEDGLAHGLGQAERGGGIYCSETTVTISNNVIAENTADFDGGGIYCYGASPTIVGNRIADNAAGHSGAGIALSDGSAPTIQVNDITGNDANNWGGGLCILSGCNAQIIGNRIGDNEASTNTGGGVYCIGASPTFEHNLVAGNDAAGNGSGMCLEGTSAPVLDLSTIAVNDGQGVYVSAPCTPAITNCIVAQNTGTDLTGASATYSCVQSGTTAGTGNITALPLFANPDPDPDVWDFHLKSMGGRWTSGGWVVDTVHSPCIDAGDPGAAFGNEPEDNGDRVNMGAYGNTSQASKWPAAPAVVYVDDDYAPGGANGGHFWGHDAFDTIQAGIDRVTSPGTVNVAAGTYRENLIWDTKDLQLIGAGIDISIVNGDLDAPPPPGEGDPPPDPAPGEGGEDSCLRLYDVPAGARIEGFTFKYGNATTDDDVGGGIYCSSSLPTIADCEVTYCYAYYGGGIACVDSSTVALDNVSVHHNVTGHSGAGVYCHYSTVTLTSCTISDNEASGSGGGFYSTFLSTANITGGTVGPDNSAALEGGGVYCSRTNGTIDNLTVSDNTAPKGAGLSLHLYAPGLTNCTIEDNTAAEYGGGVYLEECVASITGNTTIEGNEATTYDGGGIYCTGASDPVPVIDDNTIHDNSAGRYGGGIATKDSSPAITRNTISLNTADHGGDGEGGGIGVDSGSYPTIDNNNTITGNSANHGGGIFLRNGSSAQITGNEITSNDATNDGGGIKCTGSNSSIDDNTISLNTARDGGGIYSDKNCIISNNEISDNTADYKGGGIRCQNFTGAIRGNQITGNSSTNEDGGGIYCGDMPGGLIEGNEISDNTAAGRGGGIACRLGGAPTIKGNVILGNEATSQPGGGIFCDGACDSLVSGNLIAGNSASSGGGVALDGTTVVLDGNTICDNDATTNGGGVHLWNASSATITNCIIAFNDALGGVEVGSGSPCAITYCDVYGNVGGDYVAMTDLTGTGGNISVDPLFIDAAGGDYHLKSVAGRWDPVAETWVTDGVYSPCIDAGDPASDFANETEDNGDRINMGAYGNTAEASRSVSPASVVWVDDDYTAGGANGGHTWGHDAFDSIQRAIDRVASPGTVNVAAGTYRENLVWDTKDLQVLGAGRDVCTVNGDVDDDGTGDGSCLRIADVPASALVQGFTFRDGRAQHTSDVRKYGGGIYIYNSSPTITGCTLTDNSAQWSGGGIFLTSSSPTISSNIISDNTAGGGGGGISTQSSNPTISHNTFTGNSVDGYGGGVHCYQSDATISGNVFTGNSTPWLGGGIFSQNSIPTISNNTLCGNSAGDDGGGIYVDNWPPPDSPVVISGNIIAFSTDGEGIYVGNGSPTVSYCDVYGNADGNYGGHPDQTGLNDNISEDPLFANAAGGDCHLKSTVGRWNGSAWVTDAVDSPCIDRGDPASAWGNEPTPNGGLVNMGAWGNTVQASKSAPRRLTLTSAAAGSVLVDGTPHSLPWEGTFPSGTLVQIVPVPNAGWELDQWSGDVPSTDTHDNPLELRMSQDRTVNTHFRRERRALHIDYAGAGTVLVNGTPQTLPYDGTFIVGTTVTIDAVPNSNWEFDAWTGEVPDADKRNDPLDLVMDQNRSIRPCFRRERRTLSVEWAGAGTITVNGTPQALPYTGAFPHGDAVTVDPIPQSGWEFQRWDGDVAVADRLDDPLQVTMDGDRSIRPCFQRERCTLTVEWAGAGTVLVDGTPQSLPYSGRHVIGTTVEVTAQANAGWGFQVWSGDVPAGHTRNNPLQLVLDQDRTIKPHFQRVRTLSIGWAGAGTVLVNGSPQPLPFMGTFALNATVTVDAVANPTYAFDQWSGDVPAADRFDDPLQVVMDQDRAINPHFLAGRHLIVEWAGAGTVLVDGSPQTLPYEGWFRPGSTVMVDPRANPGYLFQVWSGDVPAGQEHDDPMDLLMDGDRVIRPHFMSDGGSGPDQVMAVTARPAGGGVEVCFTLSAPASVSAEVLNIAGRPIKRIVTDRSCAAGVQSLAWNGCSDFGTRVPSGTYVLRLSACSGNGQRGETITTVRMR